MPAKIKENGKVKETKKTSKTSTKRVAKPAAKAPTVKGKTAKAKTDKTKTSKVSTTKTAKKSAIAKKTSKQPIVEKTKKAKATIKAAAKSTAKKTPSTKKTATNKKATTSSKKTVSTKSKPKASRNTSSSIEYYDLPYNYDKTMVRVLFQTPKKLFVYWEISEADRIKLMAENGKDFFENSTPFLLVKNITKNYSFEIEINDYANSWYFDVPDSKCDYNVELIRKNNYTHIPVPIHSSNELEVPNNHILFEKSRNEVFFRNVKTDYVTSKKIVNLHFIQYAGKARPVTLNAFYNKFYDEKDLYNLNNPSSF